MRTDTSIQSASYVVAVGTKAMTPAGLGQSMIRYGSTLSKRRVQVNLNDFAGDFQIRSSGSFIDVFFDVMNAS